MSKSSNTVIIVDSPFQLLCGIEFIKSQGLRNSSEIHLFAVNNKSEENSDQINILYNLFSEEFRSNKQVEIKNKPGIINFYHYLKVYRSIIHAIKTLNPEILILGDYANEYFRHLANKFIDKSIVALDDGFGTIQTFNIDTWHSKDAEEILKKILSFGYYNSKKREIELFTIFDNVVNYRNTIQNSFSYLNQTMSGVIRSNDSYIIGAPVVEDGIIDKDDYLNYLANITQKLDKSTTYYVPHRREEEVKLKEITFKFGVRIKKVGMPVELFFCMNKIIPNYTVSFFSTSLYNLSKLFGNKANIISVKFKSSHIKKRNDHIHNIYDLLSKEVIIEEFE